MTRPLPIRLHQAEVRICGDLVSVSAHNIMVETKVRPSLAAAMWDQLGAKSGQVSVTVRGSAAGAELIRLGEGKFGMRVWIGPLSFSTPVRTTYFEQLRSQEMAAQEVEGAEHAA